MKQLENSQRPETGRMKFGDDWVGIFIRGDNAQYYSMILEEIRKNLDPLKHDVFNVAQFESLINLLSNSSEYVNLEIQELKEFKQCLKI